MSDIQTFETYEDAQAIMFARGLDHYPGQPAVYPALRRIDGEKVYVIECFKDGEFQRLRKDGSVR